VFLLLAAVAGWLRKAAPMSACALCRISEKELESCMAPMMASSPLPVSSRPAIKHCVILFIFIF
jgi:hypothetical protein